MMAHCPYCGTNVKEDELYCLKCGKELPKDLHVRLQPAKQWSRLWYLPMLMVILAVLSAAVFYFFLEKQSALAKDSFVQAEESIEEGNYKRAKQQFNQALKYKSNFPQATASLQFMDTALTVQDNLEKAMMLMEKEDFQKALTLVNDSEGMLKNYNGTAITKIVETIGNKRNIIKIAQLKKELGENPGIDDLKILLWDAESIKNEEAQQMTAHIRKQIVDFTFSKASELLNGKHFSNAQTLVEDGLKYAPESEKLQSLKTTIDKEKTAFETAQQERIEQAIHTAEIERKRNETDAIELVSARALNDDKNNLVVKGEVKSVATVPLNSVLIEYTLSSKDGQKIANNKIYVYPDTLYPGDSGKFEFTHFDIDETAKNVKIDIDKIKWYTK